MSIEPEAILRDALALPSRARAVVASELLASLEERAVDDAEAVAAAWAQELEQRARRVLSGEDSGESWPLVRDRLRDSLGEPAGPVLSRGRRRA